MTLSEMLIPAVSARHLINGFGALTRRSAARIKKFADDFRDRRLAGA